MKESTKVITRLLKQADVTVNGKNAHDITVHDDRFFDRVMAHGSLGLGESYMEGWWDCKELDSFFYNIKKADIAKQVSPLSLMIPALKAKVANLQTKRLSRRVAEKHYDLGNTFYEHMLDPHMQYTCAYFKDAKNLNDAQEAKLRLVCEKLKLKPGMTVLELGGGFGGLARYIAKNYGCHVTSYNISSQQVAYAKKICTGLPVNIMHKDYREATGTFDRVVSVGMCEHVGYKNYASFMKLAHDRLKDKGLFVLHTIGKNKTLLTFDPWIDKYIFPGGFLPSVSQLSKAAEPYFVMEDVHNFGADYDKTLMAWYYNLNKNWKAVGKDTVADERFRRMWNYYLLACAGSFRARDIELYQFVFAKGGVPGGYESVR